VSHLTLVPKSKQLIFEAFQDFILSKKAALRSPRTIEQYEKTVGEFISWVDVIDTNEMKSRHIRAFLAHVASRNVSSATVAYYARGLKAFVRFCNAEGYIERELLFDIPKVKDTPKNVLMADDLKRVLDACLSNRDIAIILMLLDTGIRRSEFLALNWGDVDIPSGLIKIREGKGGKARSVVIGARTRRAMLKYRRDVPHDLNNPVWVSQRGGRLKGSGLRMALDRIGERAGLHIHPHMLRRTFATWSLRSGMNPLTLQLLMGHSSLAMTQKYIRYFDDDLLEQHARYGPVDKLSKY
jgi:integrase